MAYHIHIYASKLTACLQQAPLPMVSQIISGRRFSGHSLATGDSKRN